jgi:signal transduction histidine kinase/ActR/RegA family two-component response regulator
LTATTQNGALRMNCDRAFISLIDSSTQYILAEATRSISLRDSTSFANPQDALFLGVQSLNKEYGICPQSVAIFTDRTGRLAVHSHGVVADTTRYVIRDLRELDQYKHCPYVVGFPHMVSYAEVPVKSASGHVLGTYCVMDNKIRDDFFDDSTIAVLNDIAACITEQLELHAIRQESGRGVQMMRGLSEFIEGRRSRVDNAGATARKGSLATITEYFDGPPQQPESTSSSTSLESAKQSSSLALGPTATPLTPPEDLLSPTSPGVCEPALRTSDNPLSGCRTIKDIYSGAAHLIRAAIDVEGLVFLNGSADKASSGRSQSFSKLTPAPAILEDNASSLLCEVLGSSVVPGGCSLGTLQDPLRINDASLRYLIRNFPRGCVFVSDAQCNPVFENEGAFIAQTFAPQAASIAIQLSADLQSLVHKARSLVFLPLWDSTQEIIVAGMLGWTSDPTRVLAEQDMTCLSAFGNTFVTEIARTEMTELARAKSDFLSSISHELRSPLHGIHAAVDLLQDPEHDSKLELIEMISSCSSTLLDTLNHVLDFSRVNKLTDVSLEPQALAPSEKHEVNPNPFGEMSQEYLCDLVLSVVEGLHFGQASRKATFEKLQSTIVDKVAESNASSNTLLLDSAAQKKSSPQATDAVAVYVDIESRSDWCMMVCAGAWKRLVMNLFANALKYTHQGFVEVSLKIVPDSKDPLRRCAHLMVSDTGIGMSPEFLRRSLYQPFVQENPIADGTGLGLSIVKKIVADLQGTIDVQSTQGVGTRFDVFVPISDECVQTEPLRFGGQRLDPGATLKDRTICLLSPSGMHRDDSMSAANAELHHRRTTTMQSYVRSIAQTWFGMNVLTSHNLEAVEADVILAEETHLASLVLANPGILKKLSQQRIVLVDALPLHHPSKIRLPSTTVNLAYPLSPKALVRALKASLNSTIELQNLSLKHTLPLPSQQVDETRPEKPGPKTPTDAPKRRKQHDRPSETDTEPQNQQYFLLVDDNAINLRLLATFMKKLGYTSETAVNGLEAFEKFKASPTRFTTILMDISMPVMNGYESSRAIRSHEKSLEEQGENIQAARIIALTGLGSEASKQEAKMSGIDEFYTKPVKFNALKELLGK